MCDQSDSGERVGAIALVGFMGSGKSSVGTELAARLGWGFVDTDDLVEAAAGRTIADLFATDGEAAFRELEAAAVREAASRGRVVIATGGGVVLRPENVAALRTAGAVVLLATTPAAVWERIAHETHRPLLQAPDPVARIADLMDQRKAAYARAEYVVDTVGRSVAQVTDDVLAVVGIRTSLPGGQRMSHRITVDLGERAYDIQIGLNSRSQLPAELKRFGDVDHVVVVTSPALRALYGDDVAAGLRNAGLRASIAEMPDGEQEKTLATAGSLYDRFVDLRVERSSMVVALGGGVVGDVAGFVAATYMRGVRVVQMPTTLISQVDSSVGGKTAVDHPSGKNLIGAFHQPRLVLIDIATLRTLPDRQLRSGLAEVLRYAVIQSPELFALLEARMPAILAGDDSVLTEIVRKSVAIKAAIVEEDETESGVRGTLNYGHTFGHAIEAVTGYTRFLHGEAVAIGMACAAEMAAARGMVDRQFCDRQRAVINSAGLAAGCPSDIDLDAVVAAMKLDKKVKSGRVRFVVPTGVGSVEIRDDFSDVEARDAIAATIGV